MFSTPREKGANFSSSSFFCAKQLVQNTLTLWLGTTGSLLGRHVTYLFEKKGEGVVGLCLSRSVARPWPTLLVAKSGAHLGQEVLGGGTTFIFTALKNTWLHRPSLRLKQIGM